MAFSRLTHHPLWSIAEVVREVMKQSAGEKHTLAQCARVSRAFSEPALEVLWEQQSGLDKLFGLLSPSIKIVKAGDDEYAVPHGLRRISTSFVLCDVILDEQWARLRYYARLVRDLTSHDDAVDALVAAVIIRKLNGRSLFPRLKCLVWKRPFDAAASALLVMLLSPMIRTVNLDILEDGVLRLTHHFQKTPTAAEYAYGMVLRMIHSHAPKVEDMELWTSGFPCSVDRLRDFDNLRVLTLRQVTNLVFLFDVFNSLPLLQKLDIYMARYHSAEPEPNLAPLPEVTLPSLTCLELSGSPAEVLAAVGAMHAPNLHSVGLSFEAKEEVWRRCSEIIASRSAHTLRQLDFTVEDLVDVPELPHSLHDWFSPLYALRGLRSVRIVSDVDTSFAIAAQDVHDLATAWPQLRSLCLPTVQDELCPELPITVLETFATKCPCMETLIFPLPHHAALLEDAVRMIPAGMNAMKEISLFGGEWPPDVHETCVSYIQKLFPEADPILFDDDF